MKRFHQIFGISIVIVFLLTGQYMAIHLNSLNGMPDGQRMLYRSRHIYILLSGLLNVGIGTYLTDRLTRGRRILQLVGSGMIATAPGLFLLAFFYEPNLPALQTPLSLLGMIIIFAGTLLHLFSGWRKK
jgi:hypothetical protein